MMVWVSQMSLLSHLLRYISVFNVLQPATPQIVGPTDKPIGTISLCPQPSGGLEGGGDDAGFGVQAV